MNKNLKCAARCKEKKIRKKIKLANISLQMRDVWIIFSNLKYVAWNIQYFGSIQKQPQEVSIKKAIHVCNFIKKRLQHGCCLVNIAKFLKTPILKNISKRLPHYFCPWKRLFLKPGPGPWTQTLKNVGPEIPGLWKTWA